MSSRVVLFLLAAAILVVGGCGNGLTKQRRVVVSYNGTRLPEIHILPTLATGTQFGEVAVGSSLERTFRVTNEHLGTVTFVADPTVWIEGDHKDDFVVTATLPETLDPNTYVDITVAFRPSAPGRRGAFALIPYEQRDGSRKTLQVTFLGTGTAPVTVPGVIEVASPVTVIQNRDDAPSSLKGTDFGSADPGASETVTKVFTIRNTSGIGGLGLLSSPTVSLVGNDADQFVLSGLPADGTVVPPGGSVTFSITFAPSLPGVMEATIVIFNDDADEGFFWFNVQGTGATTS